MSLYRPRHKPPATLTDDGDWVDYCGYEQIGRREVYDEHVADLLGIAELHRAAQRSNDEQVTESADDGSDAEDHHVWHGQRLSVVE